MKSVVITGVSTGIGYEAIREMIDAGYHVFGSVRKESDVKRLNKEFGEKFTGLVFDITDHRAVECSAEMIAKKLDGQNLAGLVNNAGIAVSGPLMHLSIDEFRYQLEVNLIGVLHITQKLLPYLGTDPDFKGPPGRIINISSVSGRLAFPFIGAYATSKFALEAMSDALRRELIIYPIDVIVIEPGSVETPIWNKMPDVSKYRNTDYFHIMEHLVSKTGTNNEEMLPVSVIAKTIRKVLIKRNPKTRYLLVKKKFKNWTIPNILPDRWLDSVIFKMIKKMKDK